MHLARYQYSLLHKALGVLVLLVVVGCSTNPRQPEGVSSIDAEVRGQWQSVILDRYANEPQGLRIAIVETDVEVVLHRVIDDPRWLLTEQRRITEKINSGLRKAVIDLGLLMPSYENIASPLKARQSPPPKSTIVVTDRDEYRFEASRLIDNYTQLSGFRERGEFPMLGPAVLRLSEPLGADLVLVSRYRGWRKTRGQWRKERVSSSLLGIASLGVRYETPLKEHGELEMLLLDGVNGGLLWRGYISGAPDAVVQGIPLAFKGCWQPDC